MAKQAQSCDSLRTELEEGIRMAAKVIEAEDSLIKVQRRQIELRDQAMKVQTERILNQQGANQELRKEIKKQKGLTIAVTVVSVMAIIIIL